MGADPALPAAPRLTKLIGEARTISPVVSIDVLLAGFAEYNRVIREVAAATGAILVEGEGSIPGDDAHFNDSVHFLDPGLELQAKRVLEGLVAAPAFAELLARLGSK